MTAESNKVAHADEIPIEESVSKASIGIDRKRETVEMVDIAEKRDRDRSIAPETKMMRIQSVSH